MKLEPTSMEFTYMNDDSESDSEEEDLDRTFTSESSFNISGW